MASCCTRCWTLHGMTPGVVSRIVSLVWESDAAGSANLVGTCVSPLVEAVCNNSADTGRAKVQLAVLVTKDWADNAGARVLDAHLLDWSHACTSTPKATLHAVNSRWNSYGLLGLPPSQQW